MDDKIRCQSCGMPLEESFGNFGTEADGSASTEFCTYCYQNGTFTNPDQTVDGMVASSVDFMTANLGYSEQEARELSERVIRKLRRWQ
jgi:Putative zinc ribbon domain